MVTKKAVAKPAVKKTAAKPVATPKPAKVVKPVVSDVEISPPFQMTDKWTFKCNGEVVTKAVYDSIVKDHEAFVLEKAKVAAAELLPEKKRKKK